MNAQVKEKAPAVVTAPTQKTIAETRAKIEGATLETLVSVAKDVDSTITRLQGTASQIQGSLTSKMIGLVSKQTLELVSMPVRDTLAIVGGRVPNLSTVRMAMVKMAMRYGMAHTLPHWTKVAEAKASGDGAYSAAIASIVVDGVLNAESRVALEAAAHTALAAFGVADNAKAKFLKDLGVDIQAAAEGAEEEENEGDGTNEGDGNDDAAIVADAAAQLQAEIALLREIAEAARVALGVPEDATDKEALMLIQRLEAVSPMSMDEMAAVLAD